MRYLILVVLFPLMIACSEEINKEEIHKKAEMALNERIERMEGVLTVDEETCRGSWQTTIRGMEIDKGAYCEQNSKAKCQEYKEHYSQRFNNAKPILDSAFHAKFGTYYFK